MLSLGHDDLGMVGCYLELALDASTLGMPFLDQDALLICCKLGITFPYFDVAMELIDFGMTMTD